MMVMVDLMVAWMSMMSMMGMMTMVWGDELEEGLQGDVSIVGVMVEDLGEMELLGQVLNVVEGRTSLITGQLLAMRRVLREEDAAECKFPKEFELNTCDALLTAEVYLLLEHRRQSNETKDEIEEMSEVFIKTLNYARRMSRFKNRETIRAVRAIFSEKHLHKFEVAQIANLCPENAEEAKALVPSLENKIEESELEEVLKDLQSKRTFQ